MKRKKSLYDEEKDEDELVNLSEWHLNGLEVKLTKECGKDEDDHCKDKS